MGGYRGYRAGDGAAVVAAEDANFCLHWGFDMAAIRAAIDEGGNARRVDDQPAGGEERLSCGRAQLGPQGAGGGDDPGWSKLVWSKRRILEVYLNMAEFDEGVFGVEAAAQHYFGVERGRAERRAGGAAGGRAAVAQDRGRRANPSPFVRKRAAQILDGAATIRADGRAACFED